MSVGSPAAISQERVTRLPYPHSIQGEYSDTVGSSLRVHRTPGHRSLIAGMGETLASSQR